MLRDNFIFTSTWLDPALYLVRGIGLSSSPSAPQPGDVYIDVSNRYRKFDGTAFVVIGLAEDEDRVINVDSTTENVFEFNGSSWVDQGTEEHNSVIVIDDNGSNGTKQYRYNANLDAWFEICCDKSIDGGFCNSVYLPEQNFDGGNAAGVIGPSAC